MYLEDYAFHSICVDSSGLHKDLPIITNARSRRNKKRKRKWGGCVWWWAGRDFDFLEKDMQAT